MLGSDEILNDFSRLASGAADGFMNVKREMDSAVRSSLEKLLNNNGLVTKEEFDTLKDMLAKVLKEQEDIKARLARLESQ